MPETAADPWVVVAVGAAITLGSAMVTGLKLERWARRYVPLPPDVGALAGLVVGAIIVARWV